MKRLLLVLILVLMSAMAHGLEIRFGGSSKSDLPQWVSNPVSDDAENIFGIGEGQTLAKATQSALNNISGKLATVVSSNISANTTLSQGKTNVYFSENVSTKTFDTKLSSYEVVQSASQDDVYYVLVKMSRSAFVNDTKARLTAIDDRLNNRVAVANKVSKLQHYLVLNEIKPDMLEASTLVFLLQAASPAFEGEKYLATYRKYQSLLDEILFQLHIRVDATPEMAPVADMLIRLLGKNKISASQGRDDQVDAVINITGAVQNKILFSEHTTQLRVIMQIRDKSGRRINTREQVVAGSSMSSFDSSLKAAINLFQKKLEEESVLVVLGLQNS